MAEHAIFKVRVLLNQIVEFCVIDYQCILHLETQIVRIDWEMNNLMCTKQVWYGRNLFKKPHQYNI